MKKHFLLFLSLALLAWNLYSQAGISRGTSFLPPAGAEEITESYANDSVSYYDLGGHLFAGQYPINNPFFAGDTGIIYLYLVKESIVIPVDTTVFFDLGYFIFPHLPEGNYLLKARLTEQSPSFSLYFPTYFTGDLKWTTSEMVELTDNSIYEAGIHLVPTSESPGGPASLKGYVVQEATGQVFRPLGNTEVILMNEQLVPITYCFSDKDGWFRFPNLPYGTYNLMAEATGKYPAILKITLDQHHTTIDSLLLETMMHNPATVNELSSNQPTEISEVFPSPAADRISIQVKSKEPHRFGFSVFALSGEKILSFDQVISGIATITIPVTKFPGGIYFLKIISDDGNARAVKRWVKF